MTRPRDLTGCQFGELKALRHAEGSRPRKWVCLCSCGNECEVVTNKLVSGHTKSCGCLRAETGKKCSTHGLRNTPEYGVWSKMKGRCFNKNNPSYPWYGGRGVTVCKRWLDFSNFYDDMGPRPGKGYTIEREDVDGDYCPDNCSWVIDDSMQAFNQNRKSNNTSGKSGVYWRKDRSRWIAKIFAGGNHRILGSFKEKEDAIACRKEAEEKYYGREKKDGVGRVLPGDGETDIHEK